MVEVSTSILNIEKENNIKAFYDIEAAHTDYFHIDVMDGKFVEKNNEEEMFQAAMMLTSVTNTPIDVHLMVEDIESAIYDYETMHPNIITFHLEAAKTKERIETCMQRIKESGARVGISIKPDTNIEKIIPFLPYIHLVLVMTVEPGKGGQTLIPKTIEKVRQLATYCKENKIEVEIEVDGGIGLENVSTLKEAGATIIVAGTSIIQSDNWKETIAELKK